MNKYLIGLFFILGIIACQEKKSTPEPVDNCVGNEIVILYTNDEHGWMQESEYSDGSAKMMGLWRSEEGYSENGHYLILSGGDNWTGPAISTWFEGKSMVAVMNAMNYTATAVGNHEFDFKIDGLTERIGEADFAFLAANIREKNSGQIPDYIQPYIIIEINEVQVGIIGLASVTTPWTTFPDHVRSLEFTDYAEALQNIVPEVESAGAELLIVIGHLCRPELQSLAAEASQLGISVMTGGHCNELFFERRDGVMLIEGGSHMSSYARVDIKYDIDTDEIISLSAGVMLNEYGSSDPVVAQVVDYWQTEMDLILSDVIGYTDPEINRYSAEMHNLVTDTWLWAYPTADISMTNAGGIRQSIPTGDITLATIVGLLPFENSIVECQLSGTEVINCAQRQLVGGMTTVGGYFHPDGTPLVADSVYHVLTTDYLYARDDLSFRYYDPEPYYTGIHYRQPVIDWIESLNTSSSDPLNNYLDNSQR